MDYTELREETLRELIAAGDVEGFSALGFPTTDDPNGADFHYLLVIRLKSREGLKIYYNTRGKPRSFARPASLFGFLKSIGVDLCATDILFQHQRTTTAITKEAL